jgi:hypothetical protein
MIHTCSAMTTKVRMPKSSFWAKRNTSAVSAWPARNKGAENASPMNSESGSTSSLMMPATSEGFACLARQTGNLSTRSNIS